MFIQEKKQTFKVLKEGYQPVGIKWRKTSTAKILLENGKEIDSICVNCSHPYCISYREERLNFNAIDGFPYDMNNTVCPTYAITWDDSNNIPFIEREKCISCGICIIECPFSAIYFDQDSVATVNNDTSNFYILGKGVEEDNIVSMYDSLPRYGSFIENPNKHIEQVYILLRKQHRNLPNHFPNIFIRNLLLSIEGTIAIRKQGDINVRMDVLGLLPKLSILLGEIEFGSDVLNSPRNILEDIAVLHSRYSIPVNRLRPIIFSDFLPNKRSEYWAVINDISEVLSIKVNSLTLGILMLFSWYKIDVFSLIEENKFYFKDADHSVKELIQHIFTSLGIEIEDLPGVYSVLK
jgi:ferredoxin